MSEAKAAEPSMEEILASIRQIINQNDAPATATEVQLPAGGLVSGFDAMPAPAAPAPAEDVLELQTIIEEPATAQAEPVFEMQAPAAEPPPVMPQTISRTVTPQSPMSLEEPTAMPSDDILSQATASATAAALSSLTQTLAAEESRHSLPLGNGARTLESMVLESLRPMLRAWMDEHLPAMVERLVQKEIERLTQRVG